jgi:predicted nucleic-acid-binding Zn-ribbon protein
MTVTCVKCGHDRYRRGELELSSEGGYEVVMVCANCGYPNRALASDDLDLAKALIQFFGQDAPGGSKFTHKLG